MITLQQVDKLLETKFAKFENRIVKSLFVDNSGIIKEVKLNVTEKNDPVLPSSVIPSSSAVILPSMLASMVPSSSPVSSLPAKSAKSAKSTQSVYDEFADLQIKQVHDLHYNIYITIILSNSNILITHFLFKTQKCKIQKLLFKLYTYIKFNLVHRMVVSGTLKL